MFQAMRTTAMNADKTAHIDGPLGDAFELQGARVPYQNGSEIFGQDEPADFLYRVVRGTVRTTLLLADGRRQIAAFHYEGELFGLELGQDHRFSAEAMGDCLIAVVRRSALRGDPDGALERAVWMATARELERTQDHMLLLGRKSACERVAGFLSDLLRRTSQTSIDLPMGRQDMADYLGLTIETVSRMMSQLQAGHVIQLMGPRHMVVRSPGALQRLWEGENALAAAA
jgi:CRP/FNR family nitrogen fixation transcriptional regulator